MSHTPENRGGEQLPMDDKKVLSRLVELLRRHDPVIGEYAQEILGSESLPPDEVYSGIVSLYMRYIPADNVEGTIGVDALQELRNQELFLALREFDEIANLERQTPLERLSNSSKEAWSSAVFLGELVVANSDTVMLEAATKIGHRPRKVLSIVSGGAALIAGNDVFIRFSAGAYDGQMALSIVTGGLLAWVSSAFHRADKTSTHTT